MIYEGAVSGGKELYNFPDSRDEVKVYTDADITIAFWLPFAETYGPEIAVTAPGDFVAVCNARGRITGTANVVVI